MANDNDPSPGMFELEYSKGSVKVPSEAVKKHPGFAHHFTNRGNGMGLAASNSKCPCVVQIIALFLLTGQYQDMTPKTCDCDTNMYGMRINPAFCRILQVIDTANEHDLDKLVTAAGEQLPEQGESLSFTELIIILKDNDWTLQDLQAHRALATYVVDRANIIREDEEDEDLESLNWTTCGVVTDILVAGLLKQRDRIHDLLGHEV